MKTSIPLLRTLHIDLQIDDRFKREAAALGISKNSLIQKYLDVSVAVVDGKMGHTVPSVSPSVKGVDPKTASPSSASVKQSVRELRQARKLAERSYIAPK